MKKKIIIICVFVVLFLIGGICGFKYYQLQNNEFIEHYNLSDDVRLALINSDISTNPNSTFFTDAVSFQLKHKYSLMMEVVVKDSVVYTKKLGNISGKGKYYYRFSNDGKTIQFSDYLITLKDKMNGASFTKWTDIPCEVDGIGHYMSVGSFFKKNDDKNIIGGVTLQKSNNYDDNDIIKIRIYATKVK